MILSSAHNEQIKSARRVRDGHDANLLFVEGERLVHDLLRSPLTIPTCFHLPNPPPTIAAQVEELKKGGTQLLPTAPQALRSLSDTVSPQGIIALAQRPSQDPVAFWQRLPVRPLLVVLDRVQDPGNLGTILRTAEAAGAHGVITLAGTTDAFSPKTLRSSMGSAFRLPILTGKTGDDVIALGQQHSLQLISAAGGGSIGYREIDWTQPTLLVLGNEANGVDPHLIAASTHSAHIVIAPSVESLNVATAAALMLFEAAHQRSLIGG